MRSLPSGNIRQNEKTFGDLPPEVLTIVLEKLTLNEKRNKLLGYRLVNSQWKEIVDSLLEKKVISRKLPIFPSMKLYGKQPEMPSVMCNRSVFRGGAKNPLSFNCLLLNGNDEFLKDPADVQMALPIFMSNFGTKLTILGLQNQIICTQSLVTLLTSTKNLKILCMDDVKLTRRSIGLIGIVDPPPLPNLTNLELKSELRDEKLNERGNVLYIWFIASYADQILKLKLETQEIVPALQKQHNYCVPGRKGELLTIAITSETSFLKLKELQIKNPNTQFLQQSETPGLTKLSLYGWHPILLSNVAELISKCDKHLREVSLDIYMYGNIGNRSGIPLTAGVVAQNVYCLTVHWSRIAGRKRMAKYILSMFPNIEFLELIQYGHAIQNVNLVGNHINRVEEINLLKQRLWSLCDREEAIDRETWAANADHLEEPINVDVLVIHPEMMLNLPEDGGAHETMQIVRNSKIGVIQKLSDLGGNVDMILAERLLKNVGVWDICRNLRTISVSSGFEPVGNVCVIQKPVFA